MVNRQVLQKKVEALLEKHPDKVAPYYLLDAQQLIQELCIYQIELEMQNKEILETQAKLESSLNKYACLYDLAPCGYLTLDGKGNIIEANQMSADLLGAAKDRLIGEKISTFIAPEDQAKALAHYKQALESGLRQVSELKVYNHPQGDTLLQLETVVEGLRTIPVQFLTTLRDISVPKWTEEELRRQNKLLRRFYEQPFIGIVLSAPTTKHWGQFNDHLCSILGYSREELAGMTWAEVTHPEDHKAETPLFESVLRGESDGYMMDKRYIRKDGTTAYAKIQVQCVRKSDGTADYFIASVMDTTAQKGAEEVNSRLLKILDSTPDFVGYADARDGRILYINQAGRVMTGVGKDEDVTKLKIADVHPAATNRLFEEEILPVAIRDGFWQGECEFLHRDGHVIPVLMILIAHKTASGEVDIFSTISRDITARKREEDELRLHRDSLELMVAERTAELNTVHKRFVHAEKLSSLGKLTGSIAHEFNNPLYGIHNIIEQTLDHLAHDAEFNPLLTLALKECDRMADMIRKLQRFYKPSPDKRLPINIHKVLDDVCLLVKKKLQLRKIVLEKHYGADLPLITAVEDQLEQVFLNLLNNAEEAIPEGGGKITLTTQIESSNLRISVQDDGEGIPLENRSEIFEPFFSTRAVKGTGLGLYVCYGIIKKHGGDIEVSCEPGNGTIIAVLLPLDAVTDAPGCSPS